MLADLCVCGLVPRRPIGTRLVLLMHHVEALRQSNTGRLARAVLEDVDIRLRGRPDKPLHLDDLLDGTRRPLLLFPGAGARLLDAALVAADPRPVTLLVSPRSTGCGTRRIPTSCPPWKPSPVPWACWRGRNCVATWRRSSGWPGTASCGAKASCPKTRWKVGCPSA